MEVSMGTSSDLWHETWSKVGKEPAKSVSLAEFDHENEELN
jgi:hypothetical protein